MAIFITAAARLNSCVDQFLSYGSNQVLTFKGIFVMRSRRSFSIAFAKKLSRVARDGYVIPHGVNRGYLSLAIMIVLILCASQSSKAAVVALDFEDLRGWNYSTKGNYLSHGFRFSPNCHIDGMVGPGNIGIGTTWLGFDAAGCQYDPPGVENDMFNPYFLGPPELRGPIPYQGVRGALWMDFTGSPFSLRSIEIKEYGGWTVASSKGGFFDSALPYWMFSSDTSDLVVDFHGSEWNHLEWLLFFGGTGSPVGFDNLVLSAPMPEPSTWLLLLAGIAAMAIRPRKTINPWGPVLMGLSTGAG